MVGLVKFTNSHSNPVWLNFLFYIDLIHRKVLVVKIVGSTDSKCEKSDYKNNISIRISSLLCSLVVG